MPYPELRCASTLCGIHCATIRASKNFRRRRSHESWKLFCRAEAAQQAMSAGNEQRKLAAIMFTDMVGYAALSQRDDKLALELLEEHRQLLREIFPRFNGTEIKTIGDAFLIEFNSALEAAQCAIEIQRTLAKRNHDVSADRRIELKIGIHIGDVVHRGGDVYGDGVNIASRIERLAGAGGICVSMDVERQIRNALEARFEKLAPTELKNISVPMDLFRIVLPWERDTPLKPERQKAFPKSAIPKWTAILILVAIAVGGFLFWQRGKPKSSAAGSAIPEKSIAGLPFENRSEDKANAYFADGIQDEILTRLAKIADLKVISRTSTQHYKSAPENLSEIARQLGVAHIVEGSVQKSGDSVRVNVQLIKASNDSHLWADTFDRKLTDIFSVESEVAKAIADQLRAKLTGQEEQVITAKPTDNPEAYDAYLRGLAYTLKAANTPANAFEAQKYLREAVQLDPKFALAWALLSTTDAVGYVTRRRGQWDKSEAYFNEVERLDPRNVNVLTQHALSYMSLRRFPEALRKLDQVLNITPDDMDTLVAKAAIAQAEGDLPRAAALLAPLHPNADDTSAIETQVYEAILERRPAPVIPRLKEILAKPDQTS